MDLIQLIIRILAFSLTFYLLLEFIVYCKVNTIVGVILIAISIVFVVLFFLLLKRYNFDKCSKCGQTIKKGYFV